MNIKKDLTFKEALEGIGISGSHVEEDLIEIIESSNCASDMNSNISKYYSDNGLGGDDRFEDLLNVIQMFLYEEPEQINFANIDYDSVIFDILGYKGSSKSLDLNTLNTYKYLEQECRVSFDRACGMFLHQDLVIQSTKKRLQHIVGPNITVHITPGSEYIFTFVDKTTLKILEIKLKP